MKLRWIYFLSAFALASVPSYSQTITTVAGSATCCKSPDGVAATSVWLTGLTGMTIDGQGNLYINLGETIRKVNSAGVITTVAGNGTPAYTGDGGPATSASLFPNGALGGLAVDAAGNLYISDSENHVVRKVDTAGIIRTVVGNGTSGYSGDGGPATSAQIDIPTGLALDSAGNLYINDWSNNHVRKVTPAGIITTFAGNGNVVYEGDGVQATKTAVHSPGGIAIDGAGNVYISELSDGRIRKVDPSGVISTFAGQTKKAVGFSGDGGPATAANLSGPLGMTVDRSGNLYFADSGNSRIRKIDAAGIITTYAGINGNASTPIGDGGPATSAFLGVTKDLAVDPAGNLLLTSSAGGVERIRKIGAAAGLSANPGTLAFSFTIGGAAPGSQTVSVTSSGAAASYTASASTTTGGPWLSVSPTSGATPGNLTVSVNPAGVPGGAYQGAVTVSASGFSPLTFSVTLTVTGAGAPSFTAAGVINALGYQTRLAPGTVFVVFGSAMGPSTLAAASGPNYPDTVGGTSITLTPASGGSAVNAKMVYAAAGQVAGLLPSSVAPGTYSMRIVYNGLTSAPQTVTVVARSFGIATANKSGSGTAQATIGNVNGGVSLTRFTTGSVAFDGLNWTLTPAHPGDTLVLWGTGGGADPANDTGGTSGDQTAAGNFQVIVSGRSVTPLYAGASSGYAGLWQINFTLPADIAPDCFASVQVSAGGELSNTVSIPIAPNGQSYCSDPQLTQDALAALDAGGTVTLGGLAVSKTVSSGVTQESLTGAFFAYNAAEYAAMFSGLKIGACVLNDRTAAATAKNPAAPDSYLDAGANLPASGPGLNAGAALGIASANPGPIYSMLPPAGTIQSGATYTIKGNGGKNVGAFTASVAFPNSFTTNLDSIATIDRTKPLIITWTGSGFDQVTIIGSSYGVVGKDASNVNIVHTVSFTCQVPAAPGSYTLPTALLSHLLPAGIDAASAANGTGILAVETSTSKPFTASLAGGGSLTFAAMSAVQAFSRNLAIQ
jgi:uncharacterized protein (TIGR03437 family)